VPAEYVLGRALVGVSKTLISLPGCGEVLCELEDYAWTGWAL